MKYTFTRLIFSQAVSLIASYLQVPLRYPLRLGASRSYIIDNAPSIELPSSEASSSAMSFTNAKHVEFPLFLEGQDTTRAAYAVFLLNKVYIYICPVGCSNSQALNLMLSLNFVQRLLVLYWRCQVEWLLLCYLKHAECLCSYPLFANFNFFLKRGCLEGDIISILLWVNKYPFWLTLTYVSFPICFSDCRI